MEPKDTKAVAKAVLVNNENKILLLLPTSKKKWHLPGGHLVQGERFRPGMEREVKEETGLTVTSAVILYNSYDFTLFLAKTSTFNVKLSKEHTKFAWVTFDEAKKKYDLTRETLRDIKKAEISAGKYPRILRAHVASVPIKKKKSEEDLDEIPIPPPVRPRHDRPGIYREPREISSNPIE